MARIDELFNTKELLNYYKARKENPLLGDTLFPSKKIQDIKFEMLTGKGGLPVSASIHAFDTATQLASREVLQKGAGKLALIKRRIAIGEEELIAINNPRTDAELKSIVSKLFDDSENMLTAVKVRIEAMRMELLSTGKIDINENNVAITLDYNVPSENKKAFDWSNKETAKPLADIEELADAIEETSGVKPNRMLTSKKILNQILACISVKKAINGVNYDKVVTRDELNTLLESMELPKIATYNAKYKIQLNNGKYETKRYFKEDVVSMFSEGTLGQTIYGLTAEEIELIGDKKMDVAKMVDNIFVGVEKEGDPVRRFTKAAATALPTLENPSELGIATINLGSVKAQNLVQEANEKVEGETKTDGNVEKK
ncbi:MAG: major capsid protein [Clostridium chrysemydis]|uniref:major capsid protein n=1 Tax=Clostridium TaxID=1485 RepID=UPI002153A219|nr:major capsid protein [Clostridium sp. LY3-2]MCR6516322.1 major capsid protein [Clostridium sp. LY3-2]